RHEAQRGVHGVGSQRAASDRFATRKGTRGRIAGMSETPSNEPGPLDDALDRYLAHLRVERALQPMTLEAYARDLLEYLDWLARQGKRTLAEATQIDVLQHLASLQQRGLSRASQARHLAALRGLHRFASAEGLSPTDPAEGVEGSRGSRPLPHFLGIEEVDRLLAQPDA